MSARNGGPGTPKTSQTVVDQAKVLRLKAKLSLLTVVATTRAEALSALFKSGSASAAAEWSIEGAIRARASVELRALYAEFGGAIPLEESVVGEVVSAEIGMEEDWGGVE